MPLKNSVNNKEVLKELEKKISPVLVVNNSSLKPYVELFDYAPENIYQQPLGSLVGFFEIKEYSEDSAYVVNFLTSVLKKEYYINPKRPVTESLDSALHKVNMALSELAKHGNVQWLGKLNAAICVLEKNSTHFSVSGSAKIFLYRNTGLTNISEDLASDMIDPHPLKTFVNVSSGRLEKNDRLLITTEDIYHLFTIQELKKNFQRFESEKMVQFLKTALSNQMEMIVSLVVEMNEPEAKKIPKITPGEPEMNIANAFSEKTFLSSSPTTKADSEDSLSIINEAESATEYTDKKTGHIYVQGETLEPGETSQVNLFLDSAKEKIGEAWYLTKNESRRKFNIFKKQISKKIEQRKIEKERIAKEKEDEMERIEQEQELLRVEEEKRLAEEQEAERILFEQQELERKESESLEQQRIAEKEEISKTKTKKELEIEARQEAFFRSNESNTPQDNIKEQEAGLSFKEKLQLAIRQQESEKQNVSQRNAVIDLRSPRKATEDQKIEMEDLDKDDFEEENEDEISLNVPIHTQAEIKKRNRQEQIEKIKNIAFGILENTKNSIFAFIQKRKENFKDESRPHLSPRFSKIKSNFTKFSTKQKLYTLLILVTIFVVPFFIAKSLNKPEKPVVNQLPEKALTQADILASEKNIKTNIEIKNILSRQDLIGSLLITNNEIIAFSKTSVLIIDKNNQAKEHQIPTDQGSITGATYMNDLSLVLIATDQNKIVSFSPISQKFSSNDINLVGKNEKNYFGTYLTYLYVLDSESGQIYRYPRAEGGFGEKSNWLKSSADFSKTSSMIIDDNIYVADGKKISKYFKGAASEMKFESSKTSINYDLVYTNLDSTSLYVLDKLNSRLVVFTKENGDIISQHHNEKLKDTTSLVIDEKNKTAYAVTSSGLISVSIQ